MAGRSYQEYLPQKIDEKAVQNMGYWSLDDLATRLARTECLLAESQPCSKLPNVCHHPRDKFHVNYNSRRHVFSWAKLKLMLGMGFGIKDDRMMKDIWKAFKPTCPNGHRGNNRHYVRADGQVCVNPYHFVLDHAAALKLNFSFPREFNDAELTFTRTPLWQVTAISDAYVFHRVGEPITAELISKRMAEASQRAQLAKQVVAPKAVYPQHTPPRPPPLATPLTPPSPATPQHTFNALQQVVHSIVHDPKPTSTSPTSSITDSSPTKSSSGADELFDVAATLLSLASSPSSMPATPLRSLDTPTRDIASSPEAPPVGTLDVLSARSSPSSSPIRCVARPVAQRFHPYHCK